ncbi:hypothetical protein ASE90_15700 [Sphingomonas sp. Leaf67]|nr:hypothetical protein ASE90_15700 [Sphingomonas sp. Leaf67]
MGANSMTASTNIRYGLPGTISDNADFAIIGSGDGKYHLMPSTGTGGVSTSNTPSAAIGGVTDPIAAEQWHLAKLGRLDTVWQEYTGKGVKVGGYDAGVQYDHPDLDGNYDKSLDIVIDGKRFDGDYRPASGGHGTAVAGIIAAERNGEGTVGIAYEATIGSANIFDPYSGGKLDQGIFVNANDLTLFYQAMNQAAKFDVVNHSWGSGAYYGTGGDRGTENTGEYTLTQTFAYVAEAGRNGLGTISVKAAGNNRIDGEGQGSTTDRHVVAVGAYRDLDGSSSYYSTRGAHLLVSAPSSDFVELGGNGVVTTDLLGRDGYNLVGDPGGKLDYTDDFGGTSAAAPMVTGVVALMLDANPDLGWRDVSNILAASATMPVPFDTPRTTYEFGGTDFVLNDSTFKLAGDDANWNGGAYHYSTDYGFGGVNAYNAVRMSEVWGLFGEARTSANEVKLSTPTLAVNLVAAAGDSYSGDALNNDFSTKPTSFSFKIDGNVDLEHVDMSINYSSLYDFTGRGAIPGSLGTLKLKLIAPDGTEAFVDTLNAFASPVAGDQSFTFGFAGFRGVQTEGTWTLQFQEHYSSAVTTINSVKLDLYGAKADANDVYTYTDEFFAMAAIAGESGRGALIDTNGGTDWINAAAISGDATINLAKGGQNSFDGTVAFTLGAKTVIENAVTGDGNDNVTGNSLANELHGMRGDDKLFGAAGADTLNGGAGRDWLDGGTGSDILTGGAGADIFFFDNARTSGMDRITDFASDDRLYTTRAIRDGNRDGYIGLGTNKLLNLDMGNSGDRVAIDGLDATKGLVYMGMKDGYYVYAMNDGTHLPAAYA